MSLQFGHAFASVLVSTQLISLLAWSFFVKAYFVTNVKHILFEICFEINIAICLLEDRVVDIQSLKCFVNACVVVVKDDKKKTRCSSESKR